tara:strand:- start:51 stop:2360 length:2310 start_codon:yes stop_codon:yes gene_type:complete
MELHISQHKNRSDEEEFLRLLEKFSPEQLDYMLKKNKKNLTNKQNINILTNYKYHYVKKQIESNSKDFINIDCQSKNFFLEKIKNNIKNICILGLVQSGKTNEIISLVYLCIRYLKIPVIIIIQNRISGYKQLESRIKNFIKEIQDFNFKIKYDKSLNNKNLEKIFNYDNPQPEVIIALANYKQLRKIQNSLDMIKQGNNGRISPFALFMDEYDDLIKRRSDTEELYSEDISEKDKKTLEKDKKKIEEYSNYIQENSIVNVGITATMLAPMLTDKMKIENIFHLIPSVNYVGFGSERINIIDITPHVTEFKNKLEIHINKLEYLIDEVDNSVDMQNKDYSILLINISDLSDIHKKVYDVFKNHFEEWSCIKLNSKGEDGNIECTLPNECYSDQKYEIGKHILDNDKNKIYDIIEEKCIVPQTCVIAQNKTKEERSYSKHSVKFENCNISDIITNLNQYTNKIAIVSGKMACRGLSFVTNDYKKHVTDMIYVPSANSHLTRNVQDMRIFGNFPNDGININLYTLENIYKEDIKNYIETQKNIINSPGNQSCQEALHKYIFNEQNVPVKKIDRIGLTRGITFNSGNKWGVPTNNTDYCKTVEDLKRKFPKYDIKLYSHHEIYQLPDNIDIECLKEKKIYNIFKDKIDKALEIFEKKHKCEENIQKRQWKIYSNYRNAWPLHNPLSIYDSIDQKRIPPLICYKENKNNKNLIDIIIRNHNYGRKELKSMEGNKIIIVFYGKDCYHYVNCDQEQYYLNDIFKKKSEQKNIIVI